MAPAGSRRSERDSVVSQVHGTRPGRGSATRTTPSKGSPSTLPMATSNATPVMSVGAAATTCIARKAEGSSSPSSRTGRRCRSRRTRTFTAMHSAFWPRAVGFWRVLLVVCWVAGGVIAGTRRSPTRRIASRDHQLGCRCGIGPATCRGRGPGRSQATAIILRLDGARRAVSTNRRRRSRGKRDRRRASLAPKRVPAPAGLPVARALLFLMWPAPPFQTAGERRVCYG